MNPMQGFVAALLEHAGALVEPIEPDGLEVVAPARVQSILGLGEWFRLGFGPALPAGARHVSIESDWLERLAELLGSRGRWMRCVLAPRGAPPGNPERVLARGLELLNATYRLNGVEPAWTRYHVYTFRYAAISEEKREGLIRLGFNLANGATQDGLLEAMLGALDDPAERPGAVPEPDALPASPAAWEGREIGEIVEQALRPRILERLERFLAGMSRRQGRDLARLRGYYGGLMRESGERAVRAARADPDGEAGERERLRRETIAREHRAKVADLRQKYAVRVEIEWIQTLELVAPVQRFDLTIRRRKGQRRFALDWNTLARRLEAAPCEYGFSADRPREVCDDALHLVSPEAHGPCPACGSQYCRACHPRACPRCRRKPQRPQQEDLPFSSSGR